MDSHRACVKLRGRRAGTKSFLRSSLKQTLRRALGHRLPIEKRRMSWVIAMKAIKAAGMKLPLAVSLPKRSLARFSEKLVKKSHLSALARSKPGKSREFLEKCSRCHLNGDVRNRKWGRCYFGNGVRNRNEVDVTLETTSEIFGGPSRLWESGLKIEMDDD
ncbi:MAG: hypothetical protein JWM68_605 [Verrucomicrobiales bacterium]|nr:hypothetical protein [Verrucomicrobiales bacterium]